MLILNVERNAEGHLLAVLGKENEGVAFRIAGPKAWGGSTKIATLKISETDLVRFVKDFCPEIIPQLASESGAEH